MNQTLPLRTIHPYGVCALQGLAMWGDRLLALDAVRGYLLQVDPLTDNTTILNPRQVSEFLGATGLAIWQNTLWFTRSDSVYFCEIEAQGDSFNVSSPKRFVTLGYPANGVAVWESTVYVSCEKAAEIVIFNRQTGVEITRFYAPGVGVEHLTVQAEHLWVADTVEQTVFCLDRGTGELLFSILTPFANPTGLTFGTEEPASGETSDWETGCLYVAYADEEPYIRDDPNSANPYQLTFRDRTFIHPLYFRYDPAKRYTLSNGFLLEVSYVEEIAPLDDVAIENLEWRIALPSDTPRQTVRQVEAVGMPFVEEVKDGQRVAVFKFDRFSKKDVHLFGWKALLEVRGIKYHLTPDDIPDPLLDLPTEFKERYLTDNDELSMDKDIVQRAAELAAGEETNLLRRVLSIRDYVYERLSYRVTVRIESPDKVLERGIGSCGEYVGVMLALLRLNGIACRTVGRYKCPPYADRKGVPLEPDFNHVWMEFYVPSFGWVPMESNPDDLEDQRLNPTRFFMGLAWYHIELGKGIRFETIATPAEPNLRERVSLGDLAINHIRFTILEELLP